MNSENARSFFITGASGFLGASIVSALRKEFPAARMELLQHRRPLPKLADVRIVSTVTIAKGATVIHAAAATHASQKVYVESNVVFTLRVVQAACAARASHFVYISTAALGADCGSYGASKAEAEKIVRESGLPFTIIRPSEIYGGASNEGISKLISLVRRFPIAPYIPRTVLAPLYADDAIQAIVRAVTLSPQNITYILAGPSVLSFREVVETIASTFGERVLLFPLPLFLSFLFATASDQVCRLKCAKNYDNSLAQEDLSFHPRSFREGLRTLSL